MAAYRHGNYPPRNLLRFFLCNRPYLHGPTGYSCHSRTGTRIVRSYLQWIGYADWGPGRRLGLQFLPWFDGGLKPIRLAGVLEFPRSAGFCRHVDLFIIDINLILITFNVIINTSFIIFVRLLKMVIVPLIFCSIVTGISGITDGKSLGRIGLKTIFYYLLTSLCAILIGLTLTNIIQPGVGLEYTSSSPVSYTHLTLPTNREV